MAFGDEDNKQPQDGGPNNEENNIIDEEDDLNSSYIDEEDFGYQIDDRQYQAQVTEQVLSANPFRDALRSDVVLPPRQNVNEEQNAGQPAQPNAGQPAEAIAPGNPELNALIPQQGDILTEHQFYKVMSRCLSTATPKFTDLDQAREYNNYLTALELLSGEEQSLTRNAEFSVTVGGQTYNTGYDSTVRSREDAWRIVHEKGRLDRLLAMPAGNTTVGAQVDSMTRSVEHAELRNKSIEFIKGREGQEYPYRNTAAPHINDRNKRFEGRSVYANAADFAAKYNDRDFRNELRSLNIQQIRQQMQGLEPGSERYQYLSDLSNYYEIVKNEGGINGDPKEYEQKSIFEIDRDMNFTDRNRIYLNHIGDPAFERSLRAVNDLSYRATADPSVSEVQKHAQEILSSPNAAGANEGYEDILALNHLHDVISREMDLKEAEFGPDIPIAEFFDKAARKEGFKKVCEDHAYDPVFRKGLNAMENMAALGDDGNDYVRRWASKSAKDADSMINEKILKDTLAPMSPEQIRNLNVSGGFEGDSGKVAGAVEKNMKQQEVMAKMLFMTQLSGAMINTTANEDDKEEAYTDSVADLFAHGHKIEFHLPNGTNEEKERVNRSIYGENYRKGEDGLYKKHKVSHRRLGTRIYNHENAVEYYGGEGKGFNYGGTNLRMDLPVGGLGNTDASGNIIGANSKHGSGYIKVTNGLDEAAGGTILFGIESDDPKHDKQSAFLSGKREFGNELGGRTVDLHHIPSKSLSNLMDRFGQYYSDLQKAALTDPEKAKELEEVNSSLSGQPMDKDQMTAFMKSKLDITPSIGGKLIGAARADAEAVQTKEMNDAVVLTAEEQAEQEALEKGIELPKPSPEEKEKLKEEQKIKFESAVRSKLFDEEIKAAGSGLKNRAREESEGQKKRPEADRRLLGTYLSDGASQLKNLNAKEQDKLICSMIGATVMAKGNMEKTFDASKLDYKKIAKLPSVEYQLKNDRAGLLASAKTANPLRLMEGSADLNKLLEADERNVQKTQANLKSLYDELNVPNLKSRSKEYQRLVKAVGQAAMKPDLNSEDRLNVINAVNNYTSRKRYIPRTEDGKISLFNAFKAMEAVVPPNNKPKLKFMGPHREHMEDLQTAMEEKGLLEPQAGGQQNNGPQQGGPAA